MSELSSAYFATGRPADLESDRLRRLDAFYAAPTQDWLMRTAGLAPGMKILEAGAGSGRMLSWFAARTGPSGDVLGLDLDLGAAAPPVPPVRHLQADLHAPAAEPERFDLVYARLVLMHLSDPLAALKALAGWLRPGGMIAIADLDCSTCGPEDPNAPGMKAFAEALDRVRDGMARTGLMDPAFGARLPELLEEAGFTDIAVERHERIVEGGSDWSMFQAENNQMIAPAVGEAEAGETVARFMSAPGLRYRDQTLVCVTARKS
ncbi:MAG: methyltransferase domain-containing protein [Oceanicaulis sp.]